MKKLLLLISTLILCLTYLSYSQPSQVRTIDLKGKVVEKETQKTLIGATVVLRSQRDSTIYHSLTNREGNFELKNVRFGPYTIKITYIGYKAIEKDIRITPNTNANLGEFEMEPTDVRTQEVVVTEKPIIGEQKGDTTEFNAEAFKTRPDAVAEDLIKKMPGVQVEQDGTVKAQGEEVKKVLVDGKQFFGDDPSIALRNLPADVIDRIQIFDKMSDQAEFTGFDDGKSVRAINIITKENRRSGMFGRLVAGAGNQEKYNASITYNYFDGPTRFSILGMSNNLNQQNFAFQDLMGFLGTTQQRTPGFRRIFSRAMPGGFFPRPQGAPSFGGGGFSDFFTGQLNGITTTHSYGINYTNIWNNNFEFTGSYFFNLSQNTNNPIINREYILNSDTNQSYNQIGLTNSQNHNHRINLQFKYDIDSNNSVIMRPNLFIQSNNSNNNTVAKTTILNDKPVNSSNSNYFSDNIGINFNNELTYRHRFIPGRTISFSLNTTLSNKEVQNNLFAQNNYYQDTPTTDSLNQQFKQPTKTYSISLNTVYTEPLSENSQLQVTYNGNFNNNLTNKEAYNFNYIDNSYDLLDSLLSNKFDNNYLTNQLGLGYNHRDSSLELNLNLSYQRADLNSKQLFPTNLKVNYKFDNLIPSLRLNYKFSEKTNLRFNYRTMTNSPSITQLQNVVDNSNPLQLYVGNPTLNQQYSHSIFSRFSSIGDNFSNIFIVFLNLNVRNDYISNSIFIAQKDTIIDNIYLPAGAQLTKPINLQGQWNISSFVAYGFPISFLGSNLNLSIGGSYSRTPSLINNNLNHSNAYNANLMFVLSSNFSENLDFTITSRANFNITKNSIRKDLNNQYNDFYSTLFLNWIFYEGLFIQGEVFNQFYTGLYEQGNNNYTLINLSAGIKFLKNNAGELKLTVFDVLRQNKSIQTNVTDYYIEYSRNDVLKQYIILTFTYNLRVFGLGQKI